LYRYISAFSVTFSLDVDGWSTQCISRLISWKESHYPLYKSVGVTGITEIHISPNSSGHISKLCGSHMSHACPMLQKSAVFLSGTEESLNVIVVFITSEKLILPSKIRWNHDKFSHSMGIHNSVHQHESRQSLEMI
jgi:hypothetical protein